MQAIRITFKELILVKHISIFHRYHLISEILKSDDFKESITTHVHGNIPGRGNRTGFVARSYPRVLNEERIIEKLIAANVGSVARIKDVEKVPLRYRKELFSSFDVIYMPPGSDNINAFLFSDYDCHLVQMINQDLDEWFQNPFLSIAGMRYMLPYLHRIAFWKSSISTGTHTGYW